MPVEKSPNNIVTVIPPTKFKPIPFSEKEKNKTVLFLLGGNGAGYVFKKNDWKNLIKNIKDMIRNHNITPILVTSRRTNKKHEDFLFQELKNSELFSFDQLIDITAIDYPSREKRFELIYNFLSMKKNKRIILKTSIKENDNLDSIINIFKASDWYERECYDLFGINFTNHPDLRRIMTDYNFEGHPLRKDFPLTGHTEVRYDDVEKKVVYEPVKLTQEYRDFDYTSPWEGMPKGIDDHNEQE